MGLYVSFGNYDPDEEPDEPGEGEFLHEPDIDRELDWWLQEKTEDEGPIVAAQGKCIVCERTALSFVKLWRWSAKHGRRFPVWTVDGCDCASCGTMGSIRQVLAPDETQW